MVNKTVDFENRILDELRLKLHCRKKNNPNHFCTQKELAENLHMSLRDVRHWLPRLVTEGKLHHERITHESKIKDKFTVIDPRQFTSKEIVTNSKQYINEQLDELEILIDKMRNNPALYDVRLHREAWKPIPYYKGKIPKKYKVSQTRRPVTLTSNVSNKGYEYLESFCDNVNQIFTYCDSLSYSQLEHKDMINELKEFSFEKIMKLIKRLVIGLSPLEKRAYYSLLLPRIPIINQLNQIQKLINLKPF